MDSKFLTTFLICTGLCQSFTFDTQSLEVIMLATRDPLKWHSKQPGYSVGLSFRANFHFALGAT